MGASHRELPPLENGCIVAATRGTCDGYEEGCVRGASEEAGFSSVPDG